MTTEPPEAHEPRYALRISDAERMRYRAMAQRAVQIEGDRWTRYGIGEGAQVADVGCGPGAVLVELARMVGERGVVVGVEPETRSRAAAEEEIASAGVANCRVAAGDGEHTGIEPASQDVVMLRHVLFHVATRAGAILTHLSSLLKPGGHLYVVDTDATAARLSFEDHDFAEQGTRYLEFQRDRGNNVAIGPLLGELIVGARLELIEHDAVYQKVPGHLLALGGPMAAAEQEMLTAGVISADDARRFAAARERVATLPHAAMFIAQYIAVGRRKAIQA
jgi:ubiquinone/menaquinone biosynthesis C-methylase UbiE